MIRFAGKQRGNSDHAYDTRGREIGSGPAPGGGHIERTGTGQECTRVPAVNRDGRTRAVFFRLQNFNTVGIDRNVLRRRQKRYQQRTGGEGGNGA